MSKHYITWEQKRSRVLKHYQPVLWRIGLSLSRTKECPQLLLPMIQNWNKPDETGENNSISAAKWTSILLQGIGESTWYSVLETKTPTIRRQTFPPQQVIITEGKGCWRAGRKCVALRSIQAEIRSRIPTLSGTWWAVPIPIAYEWSTEMCNLH